MLPAEARARAHGLQPAACVPADRRARRRCAGTRVPGGRCAPRDPAHALRRTRRRADAGGAGRGAVRAGAHRPLGPERRRAASCCRFARAPHSDACVRPGPCARAGGAAREAGRRPACADRLPAPHRVRRLVEPDPGARPRRGLRAGAAQRGPGAAAAAARAVRRLRRVAACPRAGRGARAAARALEPPPRRRGALARSADRPRAPRATDLRRHRAGLRAAAGVGGGAAEVLPRRTLHAVRRAARGLAGAAVALQRAGRFRHRRAQRRPPPRGGAGPAGLLHHHAGVPRAARAPAHAARGVPAGARRRAGRARPCRPAVRGAAGQPQGPPRSRAQPAVPGHVRRADGRRGRRARLRGRARRAARVRRCGRQVRPVAGLLHRPARRARPARIQHRPVRRHDRAAPGARLPARAAGDVGRPRPRAREPRAHRRGRRSAAARVEREPAAPPVHAARASADRSAGAPTAGCGRAGVRRHGAALW
ncbi:hypothetical protein D3C87_1056540 [compost metagenome]